MLRLVLPLCLTAVLAACQSSAPEPATRAEPAPEAGRPATIPDNACWTTDRIPAVTETTFVPSGADATLAPQEQVIAPAQDRLFAVLCPEQVTEDFIASLQRALTARGHYGGAIDGEWGPELAEAVRGYQSTQGLNSNILSLEAAQRLGLVPVPRAAL
ncbi:peptidoglycan-binding protein [Cereibacter sphaeroides]|nr:peptidoglycan-binding protein [Cereibacter sphaeroides]